MEIAEARRLSSENPRHFIEVSTPWLVGAYAARNPDWLREILLRRGRAAWYLSDRAVARAAARDLLALAASASLPVARADALLLEADELGDAGRTEAAIAKVGEAAEIMRATGDPHWRAIGQLELCDVFWGSEREDQALEHCRRAERYLRKVNDDWYLARLENMIAMLLESAGRGEEALAVAQSARERYERLGMPSSVTMVEDNMSSLLLSGGDAQQVLAMSQRSLERELASGKMQHAIASRINIAAALVELGRAGEALASLRQAVSEAEQNQLSGLLPELHEGIMGAARKAGRLEEALDAAEKAIELQQQFQSERSEIAIAEMQERFEAAEKQREIEALAAAQRIRELELARSQEENARQAEEIARQDLRLYLVYVGVGSIALISLLLLALWRASRRQGERLKRLAEIDGLTQVLNRRTFVERLQQVRDEVAAGERCACVAVIDADHFKRINDTRGHQVGDRTLQRLAAAFGESLEAGDAVGRMGGEEFAVLWVDADSERGRERAEAIRVRAAGDHLREGGLGFEVTVSIGVAAIESGQASSVEEWLLAADKALYAAKAAGRNRVVVAPAEAGRLDGPEASTVRP